MTQSEVSLERVTPEACAELREWLQRPHVAPWYPFPDDNLAWAEAPPPRGEHAIISHTGTRVGYIRWQQVDRATLDSVGLTDIPANSVDVDILLAEPRYTGIGLGPSALRALTQLLRNRTPVPPLIGLTTSVSNVRGQRAFVKAGFHVLRQYEPEGFGLCNLYVLALDRSHT